MASKRAQRRKACGKTRYDTAAAAKPAIEWAQKRGEWVRAYTCGHCHGWHIGHPPRSVRQSLSAKARNRRRLA